MWCLKLPTYEVFIDGKPRKIQITKTNECFTLKIDDKTVNAKLPTENLNMDEAFKIDVDGKVYKIELPKIDHTKPFTVKVEDTIFKAEVKTSTSKSDITTFAPVTITPTKKTFTVRKIVEDAVVAPMTGRILSVKTQKGDQVACGQILCVLEAMKMENEIVAPKSGTVREVYASEGSSVSEGEPLFIIN